MMVRGGYAVIDIEGFRNFLYEEEMAKNTIEAYVRGINQYSKLYKTVTKPNVINFKQFLVEHYKPQTVNLRLTSILAYCKYKGIEMKIKHIKEPKKTYIENVISKEQYEKLINGLKSDNNYRWYYHILLLAKTGARISEAVRITKKDIITGSVTMHTKAHMRTIYFPKSLQDELSDYIASMKDDDFIMQNSKGKSITSRGVSGKLFEFAGKYGIPKENMHPHSFRHFFAIEFLKRNSNIALLADLLGHGSVNVTQLYLRQSQQEQRKAIDDAVDW